MSQNVVIVGATSSIAVAFAREMARRGDALHLVARDSEEVARISADLRTRFNISVTSSTFDAEDVESHRQAFEQSLASLGRLDGIFYAVGYLGDQCDAEQQVDEALKTINVNYVSAVSFLTLGAMYLEKQKQGFIIAVSSVAGDRGRPSNYIYGSAKGAFSLFAQGLRSRLYKHGVHVMTVKLGFVDTKMTFGKPGMFLVAQPEAVAQAIVRALAAKRDVVYVPQFWWLIMQVIKLIPEPIFKRLKL